MTLPIHSSTCTSLCLLWSNGSNIHGPGSPINALVRKGMFTPYASASSENTIPNRPFCANFCTTVKYAGGNSVL